MRPAAILSASLALLILCGPPAASGQTLLGEEVESGGYGGPGVRLTSLNGDMGVMVGGQGAWVVNARFGIGGAGYGVTTEHEVESGGEEYELSFSYGGLMLEYFSHADRLTHLHGSLIIGAGGVILSQQGSTSDQNDTVLVLEPTLHVGLRVTSSFRVSALAGYRLVMGVNDSFVTEWDLDAADLSGFVLGLDFRFGRY